MDIKKYLSDEASLADELKGQAQLDAAYQKVKAILDESKMTLQPGTMSDFFDYVWYRTQLERIKDDHRLR